MDDVDALVEQALANPSDVAVRMAAAYACDRDGREDEAITHYDAAWDIGVPDSERIGFMLGYGSTLKNVGRLEDSERILRRAIQEAPGHEALPAFLALTLHAKGRSDEAIAELLELLTRVSSPDSQARAYSPALRSYAEVLREEAKAK